MADIIWAVKKMRNMIEFSIKPIIFYTDYSAAIGIVKTINLASSNIDKLNNRLVYISQYLLQFQFDVRYKLRKYYIIPNVLSRLSIILKLSSSIYGLDNIFNDIDNFHVILIKILNIFKDEFR
jgi:hypothetical protein